LKDIERGSFDGIGKPEPLRGDLNGFWSRRIDGVNRLVYRVSGDVMEIVSCKGHYED
ncbi:MAG: Txe/YoeB family addiction module toxin, partial [Lachnospiraceae bacterium]|nr:Txe/YoeB family addiction module toxin [Lachnospiraceae bacterium]